MHCIRTALVDVEMQVDAAADGAGIQLAVPPPLTNLHEAPSPALVTATSRSFSSTKARDGLACSGFDSSPPSTPQVGFSPVNAPPTARSGACHTQPATSCPFAAATTGMRKAGRRRSPPTPLTYAEHLAIARREGVELGRGIGEAGAAFRIGPSSLEGAGRGVFANRALPRNFIVTWFDGDKVERDAYATSTETEYRRTLVAHESCVDGIREPSAGRGAGSFLNHGHGDAVNCRFKRVECNDGTVPVLVIATTRDVAAGEELLVSYGTGYWKRAADDEGSVDEAPATGAGAAPRAGRPDFLEPPPTARGSRPRSPARGSERVARIIAEAKLSLVGAFGFE